ncbi:hypothetical protein DL93DRAFT_2098122 [Clavulina sp. PMI_390]|nr:hypothetical protein DL93DRAFT_2098122 [Clavulina sp. PMI_390]
MKVAFITALSLAVASTAAALPFVREGGSVNKRAEEINPDIIIYYRDNKSSEGAENKRAEEVNPNLILYYRTDGEDAMGTEKRDEEINPDLILYWRSETQSDQADRRAD